MELAKLIAENREQILSVARKYGAHRVRIFGSAAHGDATGDVDLLICLYGVNLDGLRHFGIIEQLRRDLKELLGRDVDIIDERGLRDKIRERVLSELT